MILRWLIAFAVAVAAGGAAAQSPQTTRAVKNAALQPPFWTRLERFEDDADFLRYVRGVQRLLESRRRYEEEQGFSVNGAPVPAPPPPPPPPSPSATPAPAAQAPAELSSASGTGEVSSITNVQTQGVDEGGIVKQIGRFLIVLQDGRLFVVDTRPGGQPGLQFVSRANVYRDASHNTWYDEMLVSGNRILVTGYSYRESASEINILTIDEAGRLSRETTYYISSNDYYDTENYATRLVAGNLVIYTPLVVLSVNPDRPMRWPLVRRWLRDEERRAVTTEGAPLFDGGDIYKPVQRTLAPMVHSVSVCPLGELRAGDELECRTTALVGGIQREFYVSTTDIYLWMTPGAWDQAIAGNCEREGAHGPMPATVYRVPLSGGAPRAMHARGQPINQLALASSADEFRALVNWNTGPCGHGGPLEVRYFHAPFSEFRAAPIAAPSDSYVLTPQPGGSRYEVRFTDTHLVYGAREGWSSYPPGANSEPLTGRVVAVPLSRPRNATVLQAPHNVIRVERAGADIVLTGYRTDQGLSISLLDLGGAPRIASTRVLDGRYESEGRSHAFNALIGPDGSGLMGLPTVPIIRESGRWWFRSGASDVSYISVNANGQLQTAGELLARADAQHPDYRCEVSCVDWYGNTRALYIGDRVFALSATELIEGALTRGRVTERRRINLSAPPPRAE